jgi:hypothetical protein
MLLPVPMIRPEPPRRERSLTQGEISILRSVFGGTIRYDSVRVYDRPFLGVFPRDRAMAPNGSLYFPYEEFLADFAGPGATLSKKALFVHEGTHLYQWYGLNWNVWARGPFDRNYEYTLVQGKRYAEYGLEQMAMIAQHYYTLRSGGTLRRPYNKYVLSDYQHLLPLGQIDASAGIRA